MSTTNPQDASRDGMKPQALVRFAHPVDDDERGERFRILELRGDRVLVEDARSDWRIPPTFVYSLTDLVETTC